MSPEEVRGWASIILSLIGVLGVAWIGGRAMWKNSRRTSQEQAEARREPTWNELVTENRSLRTELDELRDRFDATEAKHGREISALKIGQSLADRREVLLYRHTRALRDHIEKQLPPPPPTAHPELLEWFESFEDTENPYWSA